MNNLRMISQRHFRQGSADQKKGTLHRRSMNVTNLQKIWRSGVSEMFRDCQSLNHS
jgi:hypothetical protein